MIRPKLNEERVDWPGGARMALSVVVNVEEGSEQTVARGDRGMEPVDELGWGHVGPDSTPLVVVPHDPLAAFIAGEVVLRPIVRRLLGLTPERRPLVRAVHKGTTEGAVEHDRQRLVPAVLGVEDGVYAVHSVTTQGHPLAAAAEANALLVVPTGLGGCHDGDTVEVVVLERRHA